MKNWILCLFVVLFPIFIYAQDVPDKLPEKPKDSLELKEIVKSQSPLTKRIFFIIDVSGSMSSDGELKRAVQFVKTIWQSPVDEFEIAIVVFNDGTSRWGGLPSAKDDLKPTPKGWAKMPSKDAADAAQKFLDKFPGAGNTYPTDALKIALNEDRSEMSIVFITDGEYSHPPEDSEVIQTIKELQENREKKNLGKAVISVFGVGAAEKEKNLSVIGKDWLGGFYVEKKPPIPSPTASPTASNTLLPDADPSPSASPTPFLSATPPPLDIPGIDPPRSH